MEITVQGWITIGLFLWVIVGLVFKLVDEIIIGISVPTVLALTGILDAKIAFADFANTTVLFFMSMLVLGAAIFKTGLADYIGGKIIQVIGSDEKRLLIGGGLAAGSISSVMNDTGSTGCLMPIVAAMAKKAKVSVSKVYMPLAFAASLGGTLTLIGTTPHIVASGLLEKSGYQSFSFFEFTPIGLTLFVVGMTYVYFQAPKVLPAYNSDFEKLPATANPDRLKMIIVGLVFLLVVIALATNIMPFHLAAIIGSIAVIVTKCLTVEDAMKSFSMPTLFLVAGIFPLSAALVKTGAAKTIVSSLSGFAIGAHPFIAILIITGITAFLTQLMMNTSLCAIMVPLGILFAESVGLDPRGVVMAIALSSSAAFCTPFGTGPNLLVWRPGSYSMRDYFRMGFPVVIMAWLIISTMVYFIYELKLV